MTKDELRAKYNTGYRIIWRHREIWARLAEDGSQRGKEKVQELDRLQEVLAELKDELKARLENEPSQPTLLDVPGRTKYG